MAYNDNHFDILDQVFLIGESVMAVLAFLFNSIVIYLFLTSKSKTKLKLSNCIFFVQAIADLIVAFTLTLSASTKHAAEEVTKEFTTIWVFFLEYSQFLSISTLFIISSDRYLAVSYPFIHRSYITKSKVIMVAILTFAIATIPALVSVTYILQRQYLVSTFDEELSFERLQMKYQLTMGSVTLLIILTIFGLLLASYHTVKLSIKMRIKQHEALTCNQHSKIKSEKRREKKIIKLLFSMCLVYTVTYIPFALIRICYVSIIADNVPQFIGEVLIRTSALLYYTTACTDPLTTLFFKDDYVNALYYYQNCVKKAFRVYSSRSRFSSRKTTETHC